MVTARTNQQQQPALPVATWREAERRLYPLVLSAPERYEQLIRLVRCVADGLRNIKSLQDLTISVGQSGEPVARTALGMGLVLDEAESNVVAGAAFSLRYDELVVEITRAGGLERLDAARHGARSWTTLYESSSEEAEGGPLTPPYHLVEAYLPGSCGLHASVLFDPEVGMPIYRAEAVRIDLGLAEWWVDEASAISERTSTDIELWRASLAEMRETLARAS